MRCSGVPKQIAEKSSPDPGADGHLVESWPAGLVVKERQEWFGRVFGTDGRQRWIKAVDLRSGSGSPAEECGVISEVPLA
jgi:hypothetical protein